MTYRYLSVKPHTQMLKTIVALSLIVMVFLGVGWLMVQSILWARNRGPVQRSMGNALQELERIVTKPSVEHVVETESKILKEVDHDGE